MNLFTRCILNFPSSRHTRFFTFLLFLTSLLVPAALRAQAPQEDPGQFQLRPRTRPSLLELDPAPTRRVRGVKYKVNRLAADGVHANNVTPGCTSPQVSYVGGPVISNVQPVAVFWSSNVNPQLTAPITGVAQFLADVGSSVYFGVLSQYSTFGTAITDGTDQWIGNGSTTPSGYTLTPSVCGGTDSCTVTDDEIQTELNAQITAGNLPQPTYDSLGNPNTVYMTYFPPNVTVTDAQYNITSCTDFCAYHSTGHVGTSSNPLIYGVVMDEFSGSACYGCTDDPTELDDMTDTTAHELAEAITDADIGLDTNNSAYFAYPAAWGDNSNDACAGDEIADICEVGEGDPIAVNGRTWYVQEIWSIKDNQCESHGTVTLPFAFSSPGTVTAGTPFNLTVTVQNPTGGTYTGYMGTVHFTSSDSSATLPADYTYVAGDAGVHAFQATLKTGTSATITVTDTAHPTITLTTSGIPIAQGAPAVLNTPSPGTTLTSNTVTFTWTAGTGVSAYDLHLSAVAPGGYDLYLSGHVTSLSTTVSGLPFNGQKIYARLYSIINGATQYNDYTYTAETVPTSQLTSPAPSSTLTGASIKFTWSAVTGVSAYDLHLSAVSPGGYDLYLSGHVTTTSATVKGLPINGKKIYARLYSIVGGVTYYNDYTYTAASLATLKYPAPGSTLKSTSVFFEWTAGGGVSAYDLHLSAVAAGGYDLYSSGHTTSTIKTVNGLPANGEPIYARLYSIIGGVTYYNDYTYKAK